MNVPGKCRICDKKSKITNSVQRTLWRQHGMCKSCLEMCEICAQPKSMIVTYNHKKWT